MSSPIAAYHPELVLVGAAATAIGVAVGRIRRGAELEAATSVVACWAALAGHIEPIAAIGAAILAATALPRGGTPRPASGPLSPAAATLLVASCAATFGGAPDTELAVATGSAVALVSCAAACVGRLRASTPNPVVVGWATPALLVLSAVGSYRGRPAGLPAATVACAAVLVAVLVAARTAGPASPRIVVVTTTTTAAALVAARTIGLQQDATAASLVVGIGLAGAVVAAGWWATGLSAPDEGPGPRAPARTRPG